MTTNSVEETSINVFWNENLAVSIRSDGTIIYGDQYIPDEAAKIFWKVIKEEHPYSQEIAELRERLSKYENLTPKQSEDPIASYERAMKIIGRS